MRVNRSRPDIGMTKQFLDGSDIVASLQHCRREGMAQTVWCRRLGNAGTFQDAFECPLERLVVHVMTAYDTGTLAARVAGWRRPWKRMKVRTQWTQASSVRML
jgi:hypothetical protein